MAITAAIRYCLFIMALAAMTAAFASSSEARVATDKPLESVAAIDHDRFGKRASSSEARSKTPCKRHKASAHHSCQTCSGPLLIRPVARTRPFLPAQRLKFSVAGTVDDRIALAAAQASARLVLAGGSFLHSDSAASEVIARTARLRN